MKYRQLGDTGIEVSEIGFGAWQIGGPVRVYFEDRGWISHGWGQVDDEESIRLIKSSGDMGINFIDTAGGYGHGHSEEVVGCAIKGERHKWIIETKGGEGMEDNVRWRDFSKKRLLRQIDESLQRLNTDYVDVYLLHGPSREDMARGECLEAIMEIKEKGKARSVGVSVGDHTMTKDFICNYSLDVIQIIFNIINQGNTREILPLARAHGVGLVARRVMAGGFLAGKITEKTEFAPDDRRSWESREQQLKLINIVEKLRALEKPGRSMAQVCLKYPLTFPEISTVIPGSKSIQSMKENIGASKAPDFTDEELQFIKEIQRGI